jgi:hypothetical protein
MELPPAFLDELGAVPNASLLGFKIAVGAI